MAVKRKYENDPQRIVLPERLGRSDDEGGREPMKKVGRIVSYLKDKGKAVLVVTEGELKVRDEIKIVGRGEVTYQDVYAMWVGGEMVQSAKVGDTVTVWARRPVVVGDEVYHGYSGQVHLAHETGYPNDVAKLVKLQAIQETVILLGEEVFSKEPVGLGAEDRKQGLYLVGLTGTGKTSLILNIAMQDIIQGDGLCVLDPHGDLTKEIMRRVPPEREEDVILFDPADDKRPFGLNFFECSRPEDGMEQDRVCSEVMGTFWKLFAEFWGPRMADLLRNTILTFIANQGYTLAEVPRFLTDKDYRRTFLPKVTNPQVRWYWQEFFDHKSARDQGEIIESSLNKVGRFLSNTLVRNIVGQSTSSFDMRKVMDEGKILLVNLSKGQLGEDNSSLLGSILVGKILIAALSRADIAEGERKPFHLIVDEYQSFATSSFPTLQSEARKYNIDTIVAHQYRDQLDEINRGSTLNVGSKVVFRVNGKDAADLAAEFNNTPPPPPIIGEKPILGLSHSPWSELERRSHRNPAVSELVILLGNTYVAKSFAHAYDTHYSGSVEGTCHLETFHKGKRGEDAIAYSIKHLDLYLAERMRGTADAELEVQRARILERGPYEEFKYLYDLEALELPSGDALPDEVSVLVNKLAISLIGMDEAFKRLTEASNKWSKLNVPLEMTRVYLKSGFILAVKELGDLLEREPVLVPTGQTEPQFGQPRPYNDVEAETANKLTNLPNFQAMCKLIQGGELGEYSIATLPPAKAREGDEDMTEWIRQGSRDVYGRPKSEVENSIIKRGGFEGAHGGTETTYYEKT
jgi:hypothetical protein